MFESIIKQGIYIKNKQIYDLIEQVIGEPVFPIIFRKNKDFYSMSFTKTKNKEIISIASNGRDMLVLMKKNNSQKFIKISKAEKMIWNQVLNTIMENLKLHEGS